MSRIVLSIISVVFMVAIHTVQAANDVRLPRGVTQVTHVEGITEYRLKNGLTVLLFPDQSKETVTVNVTYKVGSKHESYGETGMAHLLEHLLFKGSKHHRNITEEISARGAEANGTTWIDRTNYYETFNATAENLDWALRMEADRMVNSFVAKADLDSEMTVVRNEFERSENSPFSVLLQRITAAAYRWHNNGNPSIGARSDIENVSIERLQDFYRRYYQPDNAVLTVAGKFDEVELLAKIQKYFGKIAKPKRELPKLYTVEPPQDGEKSVVVRRVGDIQWYASAYHIPAGSHADYAPLDVLSEILGNTPRGRLHKALVESGVAVSTFGFAWQLQDPGMMVFAARVPKENDLEKAREALLKEVENIAQTPITEEEVERAKRNLLKQYTQAFNSSQNIAILLSEYIGMGDWRLLFLTRDRIESVKVDDVQRVAQHYLVRNNRTEGRFYPSTSPERVEIPAAEDVALLLRGYEGREGVAQGEEFDASLTNIESLTREHTLSSGAKVALLPRKTRGEEVVVELSMQYGTEESLAGLRAVGQLTGSMLMHGSVKYDRQALQDYLDELQASARASGSITGAYGSALTNRQQLAKVIELLAEVLQNPTFDARELDQLKKRMIANLEDSRRDPQSLVSRDLRRFYASWPKGHPYYQPTLDEEIAEIAAVTVEDLKQFHQRFYAANHMQISVVGDFDVEQTVQVLEQYLGQWRKSEPYQRIFMTYYDRPQLQQRHLTPDKENAVVNTLLPIPVGNNHADAAALELGTYIFGGGFLNSRLTNRLRQKDGLSYNSGAWINLSKWADNGQFTIYAIFSPTNREAVERGIREELARVLKDGFTEKELAEAKSGILQASKVSLSQPGELTSVLLNVLELQQGFEPLKQREKEVQALTAKQVLEAMRRHISVDHLSFVWAGDFKESQAVEPKTQAPTLIPATP